MTLIKYKQKVLVALIKVECISTLGREGCERNKELLSPQSSPTQPQVVTLNEMTSQQDFMKILMTSKY